MKHLGMFERDNKQRSAVAGLSDEEIEARIAELVGQA